MEVLSKMEIRQQLKFISLMLEYPQEELVDSEWALEDLSPFDAELSDALNSFLDYFKGTPLQVLQENYVRTFDFNEQANLYLTYSKLGDEKERGQALAELKEMYERSGLILDSDELPDYLPLVLEFISRADVKTGLLLMNRFREPVAQLQRALEEIESPYAALVEGLLLIFDHTISKGVL